MVGGRLSDRTRETLGAVSTATLATQLLKRGLRNVALAGPRLVAHSGSMVGEAFTLRYIPAREDLDVLEVFQDYDHPQRRAIETAPPGSVLVMDARGDARAATFGGILATRFARRGGAGIVTDGAVRDWSAVAALDLPVFAPGPSPATNLVHHHAVDLEVPVACGGVAVYPGDVIVGDADGVVCLPRGLADEVAQAAVEQERLEEFLEAEIQRGAPLRGTYPPDEATLARYERSREG